MKIRTTTLLTTLAALTLAVGSASAALLDDHFDNGNLGTGGTNGGFQLTQNGAAPTASAGESSTVGTVTTGGNDNNAGLYSVNSVDLAAQTLGFTATFVIDSAVTPQNNGIFLGITDDATTFFRGADNFGIIIGSKIYGSGANDIVLVSNDGGTAVTQATLLTDIDFSSLSSGFTATITVNTDDTYSASVTGITGTGTGIASGSLSGIAYAGQFDNAEHAIASHQSGNSVGGFVLGVDRITIAAVPEPGSLALLGLGGLLVASRRRRG